MGTFESSRSHIIQKKSLKTLALSLSLQIRSSLLVRGGIDRPSGESQFNNELIRFQYCLLPRDSDEILDDNFTKYSCFADKTNLLHLFLISLNFAQSPIVFVLFANLCCRFFLRIHRLTSVVSQGGLFF